MNKETKENIQGIILVVIILTTFFFVGYTVGHYSGYMERMEEEQRSDCRANNSYKPFSEVEANCIKYFTEETK